MRCEEVLELVATGGESRAVESHLAVCPDCRSRQSAARSLGDRLSDPLMWEEPSRRVMESVLADIAGESTVPRPRRRWWVLGAAAAMAAVLLVPGFFRAPDWTLDLVVGSAGPPEAAAVVSGWNLDEGTRMVLDIEGLPAVGDDAFYELWLTAPDGRHVSAGTFTASGTVEVTAGVRRSDFPRLWITREPNDHDPAPFPETVLDTELG